MTVFSKRNRTSRLRAIRVYLLVILIGVLLLFCLSIITLYEQRQKAKELSSSNLRLLGEQMTQDLERQIESLATDCLSKRMMERLSNTPGPEQPLEKLRRYREQFEILGKIYPIAEHFFIFEQNRLVYPRISSPPPQAINSFQSADYPPSFRRYAELLAKGERAELQLGIPAQAAQAYQRAQGLDVNPRLKALALSRSARALKSSGQDTEAEKAYQVLLQSYGDQYDEFQTPYVLSIATNADEFAQKIFRTSHLSPYQIYRDLIEGKWELSADQADSFMTKLEQRYKIPTHSAHATRFLDHFQLAKAVSKELDTGQEHQPFEIAPQAFKQGDKFYQTFRISMPGEKNRAVIVGFSVSMSGLNDLLVSIYAREPQYGAIETVSLVDDSKIENEGISDRDIYIPFRTILPFWQLHISAEAMQLSQIAASREVWFIGISVFMFLCILGLGLFLFIRVSWDIHWFQLRSDFVSGVSHEFKTPLSLIRLYSETLAANDQNFSPEETKNYIRIIERESSRLSHLIENVLNFSKMEQRRSSKELPEGDLAIIVSQAINDYSEYLTMGGFTVESSISPRLPHVRFNPEQVSQMVVNLLDNATKYSGQSRLIVVSIRPEGNEVVVEVRDNGIGIPADEKDKIFQAFYRLSRGSEKGGCGLGLYLVEQVMKEHGGRVEVESEVGKGSRFRLIFPISARQHAISRTRNRKVFRNEPEDIRKSEQSL